MSFKPPYKRRKVPEYIRAEVVARDGVHCVYCGKGPLHKGKLYLDHIVAGSRGGQTTPANLTVSCGPCNMRKSARELNHYIEQRLLEIDRERRTLEALLLSTR